MTPTDRAAIRARLEQAQSQYGAAHAMTWRDLYEYGAEPYRDLPTDLAALLADVERRDEALKARDAEVEHWVQRYNELEAWRAQTSKLHLQAEARADALAQQVETQADTIARLEGERDTFQQASAQTGARWATAEQRIARLEGALREVERHCPCGARPESLHTHPHSTGCPVGAALGAQA